MVGYPDERPPFDALTTLKSAKKKISKHPVLGSMFDDDEDYDKKRHAYALGSMGVDLTDDEEIVANMASDVTMSPAAPDFDLYGDGDYDQHEPEELDPEERFYNSQDSMPIRQPLQRIVSQMLPELQISKYTRNPQAKQDTTTYHTPDKKYQILMSFRPEYTSEEEPHFSTPPEYTIEVRKYWPKYKKYEQAQSKYPGSSRPTFFDGTKAFMSSFYYTSLFLEETLKELKTYLKALGSL